MRILFPRASRIAAARSALAVLLAGLASTAMAQVPAVDWKAERAEILRHYRALVQIDTSNPPGNETLAANYLKGVFEAASIPVKTFALEPARANLVARIKGNGSKRPVLIMAHTDVVGVQREKWPVDPFGAVAKDVYIWGRGTKDDKDKLTANLITMLLAKRLDVPLDRDLIFLAEAGEEGTTTVGIDFMVKEHFDDIDAEFAITEGGGATLEEGRVTVVNTRPPRRSLAERGWSRAALRGTDRFPVSTTPLSISQPRLPKLAHGKPRCGSTTPRGSISKDWPASVRQTRPSDIAPSSTRSAPQRSSATSRRTSHSAIPCFAPPSSRPFSKAGSGPTSSRRKRKRHWTSAPCRMKTCPGSSRR